jgi:hypothetical protein
MLDTLLNIGCAFDWITPTAAFVEDFFNGPTQISDFGIPANAGWDRADIKRLLTTRGVKVWGLMYNTTGDTMMFTVRKSQAKWTYYLLQREGIPVLYAPAEVVNSAPQGTPKKTNTADPLESIFNFLDNMDKNF